MIVLDASLMIVLRVVQLGWDPTRVVASIAYRFEAVVPRVVQMERACVALNWAIIMQVLS
jgi:hypothetical protein